MINPVKSLGQNFLVDSNVIDNIVYSIGNLAQDSVIEIGPGLGGITKAILELGNASKVIAIEKDTRLSKALSKIENHYQGILHVIYDDALLVDESKIIKEYNLHNVRIIGNLPYNSGTKMLLKWLDSISLFKSITVVIQQEVADKIIAQPRSKLYCWLSIISQLLCEVEILFCISPESMSPRPSVNSAVVHFIPRKKPMHEVDIQKLSNLCKILFAKRRKILGNLLKISNSDFNSYRAEELSIAQLCLLTNFLEIK